MSRECCDCGKPFDLPEGSPEQFSLDVICPPCQERRSIKAASRQNAAEMAKREAMMEAIPPAFRHTVREQLPMPDRLDLALQWKFGARGLLLHGDTGCGKSRVAWEVVKRELLAGRSVRAVNAFELSRYPALFMAGDDAAGKMADALVRADLLLLDDVFKAKATERVEELLFAVLDERAAWERPCIITLNDTGGTLEGRLSSDRGPALIRRLKEHCLTLTFEKPEVVSENL